MRHPAQVSTYIKEQQRTALAGVRGHQPDKALLSFYASMEHLCSVARPLLLDYISLSAVITATAQLWTSAQANSSFKLSANMTGFELKHLYRSTLLQLEAVLPDIEARQISNILWSSAKLGLNPDASVPGMTDALAAKLLQLTKDEPRHRPWDRVRQRPLPDPQQDADSSISRRLGLALGQLGLAFTPNVALSGYWANAVLQPCDDAVTAPVVLATEGLHCLRNKKDRCVCKTSLCINPLIFHL